MKKQKMLTGILSVILFGNYVISSSYVAFATEGDSEVVENTVELEHEHSATEETKDIAEDVTTESERTTEQNDVKKVTTYQEQANIPVDAKISEIFPDPNMAQAVAELFGKTVADSLTETERNRTVISLLSKNITSIEGISVFSKLVNLKLSGNKIKSYPQELNQLPNLNVLWLNDNEITSMEGFGEVAFPALTQLYLADNQIIELPQTFVNYSIGKGTGSEVYLDNNQLTQLPENIGTIEKMRTFTVSGNFLSEVPGSLLENNTVSAMDLSNNQLVELPDTIASGSNLATLYLADNQLTSLPTSFGNLTKVRD
ncbi:leucine-rich repeat domain-containing protein [Enterococcus rivorum]|uniref:Internalin N-terminal domain-containing protein n=1 Tax=Enterococcus rivorum TaxID=762845 RepID=A0A1E5L0K7_9ENTE|nr:leucine-rich repeat domain-containing protein [Enterococcus rivorum]MBP2098504.1 Leucine-rich repeat (LRR) protein [Enterococcus rivorum]OEH83647.1 hypothetical protein BCR26_08235 [Enterococcus rivorum]